MSDWTPEVNLPTLPVLDLVAGFPGSSESDLTDEVIWSCQIRWGARKLLVLEVDRRQELCKLLVRLSNKLAPDLKGSDAYNLWARLAKSPDYLDDIATGK